MRPTRRALTLAVMALGVTGSAGHAQGITFAAPIPGLCVFGKAAVIEQSPAGRDVLARQQAAIRVLQQTVDGDRRRISEQLAQPAARSGPTRTQLLEQLNSLTIFEAQSRDRINEQTRLAFAGLEQRLTPALGKVIAQRKCAAVIDRANLFGWNNQMDITDAVAQALR